MLDLEARWELQVERPDYPARLGHVGSVVLLDVIGLAPTRPEEDPGHDIMDAIDRARGSGSVAILARIKNSRPPPGPMRKALLTKFASLGDSLKCIALAIEDTGLRGSAFRSFVSAARLLNAAPAPVIVAAHLDEAIDELAVELRFRLALMRPIRQFFATPR